MSRAIRFAEMPPSSTPASGAEHTQPGLQLPRKPRRISWWWGVFVVLIFLCAGVAASRVPDRLRAILALRGIGAGDVITYEIEGPLRTPAVKVREFVRDLQTAAPFTMPDFAGVVDWPPLQALQGEITVISVRGDLLFSSSPPFPATWGTGADWSKLGKAIRLSPELRAFQANGREFAPSEHQMTEIATALGMLGKLETVDVSHTAAPLLNDTQLDLILRSRSIRDIFVEGSVISDAGLACVSRHPSLKSFTLYANKGTTEAALLALVQDNPGIRIGIRKAGNGIWDGDERLSNPAAGSGAP